MAWRIDFTRNADKAMRKLDKLEESLDLASRGRQGHPAFDEDSDDDDDSDDYEEDDSMFADLF